MAWEVWLVFLRLGLTAFGGPAAHIALMRHELVERRRWVSEAHFLDLLGATNLIPGPNSTEMAIHLGYTRAGWRGLVLAGVGFILPAMLLVLALAWAYARFGTLPQAGWLLYGIKPVIIAIVVQALWSLGRTAVRGPFLAAIGVAAFGLYLLGINELVLLFGGAVVALLARAGRQRLTLALGALPGLSSALGLPMASAVAGYDPLTLFLSFLKIGAVLYGSGYVLLAFLRTDFVERLGWLSDTQLLDAVAIGQFTPGPLSTTATFVGYLVGGLPGALLATVAIFLPSFIFVAVTNPLLPHLRRRWWTGALLDGVNVAAVGLMAAVTLELGRAAIIDTLTVVLALVAAVLLFRFKVNSVWLILGGGLIGLAFRALGG